MKPINAQEPVYGVVHGLKFEDYLEREGLSQSQLKGLHPTPAHFLAEDEKEDEETKAAESIDRILGTICHTLILEPGAPLPDLAIRPEGMKFNTREGREWRDARRAEGKTILRQKDLDTAVAIARSVKRYPLARHALSHGHSEVSYFQTIDTPCGPLVIKGRVDFVPVGTDFLLDLKTIRDGTADFFQNESARRRYHCQAAHYLDMHNALCPDDRRNEMIFIVAEKKSPFLVASYTLNSDYLELARQDLRKDFETFAACLTGGHFPGYPQEPVVIAPPRWLVSKRRELEYAE